MSRMSEDGIPVIVSKQNPSGMKETKDKMDLINAKSEQPAFYLIHGVKIMMMMMVQVSVQKCVVIHVTK